MTLAIETAIDVSARPESIWRVLTDFASYPSWNPFIVSVEGAALEGARLAVRIQGMTFRPRVLVARQNGELRWRGQLLFPGLFDGEHYFAIDPRPGGARFTHGEIFSGLLLPLLRRRLESETRAGFEAMNQALKARAEAC